ncbi:hypothetical protein NBZ79_04870 [Sneathiella marina]|uniref:Uncharacterized protein n=1 Tax=Sneathiella marina TaxID=2950108 RepID=A0ABY4W544_9PROT|nr:hypothetical protein [Sneathiella marina]USG62310.1 hypothetical protein NBZ79_04870 [Sneathiella marina]
MTSFEKVTTSASVLLLPREGLAWADNAVPRLHWSKPFLIDHKISIAAADAYREQERDDRTILRDQLELEISDLRAEVRNFWMTEYRFLEKILSKDQLVIYAPGFLTLARLMPKKQVYCRRLVVRKYLSTCNIIMTRFTSKLVNQFVRSSVILYPTSKIFVAARKFADLANRSADQSARANKWRVIMMVRSMHMMTDIEICSFFCTENDYFCELSLLSEFVRRYKIESADIFNVSGEEINNFWTQEIQATRILQ